jgi:hypothetical protein
MHRRHANSDVVVDFALTYIVFTDYSEELAERCTRCLGHLATHQFHQASLPTFHKLLERHQNALPERFERLLTYYLSKPESERVFPFAFLYAPFTISCQALRKVDILPPLIMEARCYFWTPGRPTLRQAPGERKTLHRDNEWSLGDASIQA